MRGHRFINLLGSAGAIPSWAAPGSLFGLDFANSRYWPQQLASQTSFSRASVGEADNVSGAWSQFLSGVARITNKGLRYEPGRTNSVRNNSMVGAVAGTPGTAPTNWLLPGVAGIITAQSVIGVGTENGINYIEVSLTANAAGTMFIRQEGITSIAAASGQTWTGSQFLKLVSGGAATLATFVGERDVSGANLASSQSTGITPATLTRDSITRVFNNASTAFALPATAIIFSGAGTVQFRVGGPQLEVGASVTSPIITTGSAVARLADVLALIRTDIGRTVFTFSDGTTQTVSGITKGSPYTVPTTLNEQVIARMDGYAS